VIAECSIVKRKETNQLQWKVTRNGILEVEGRRLVGMTQNTCVETANGFRRKINFTSRLKKILSKLISRKIKDICDNIV
jgi:hypothetical protein